MEEEEAIEKLAKMVLDAAPSLLKFMKEVREDRSSLGLWETASLYALVLSSNKLRKLTDQLLSSSEKLEKLTRILTILTFILIILTALSIASVFYH